MFPIRRLHAKTTGRRKALAEWMASAENPLFARVMVNRIWQYHFGPGLLKTPSDFGTRAGKPSHPELLDWLATEFAATQVVDQGDAQADHDVGHLAASRQRLGIGSRRKIPTERAAVAHEPAAPAGGRNSRRGAAGRAASLNLKMGGMPGGSAARSEELYGIIGRPDNAWMVTPDAAEHTRRSIYLLQRRTFQQPMFEAFDAPDGVLSCPRRNESTTAPQSLAMLNSRFMMEQAKALASKVQSAEDAWQRVLGRAPSHGEATRRRNFWSGRPRDWARGPPPTRNWPGA